MSLHAVQEVGSVNPSLGQGSILNKVPDQVSPPTVRRSEWGMNQRRTPLVWIKIWYQWPLHSWGSSAASYLNELPTNIFKNVFICLVADLLKIMTSSKSLTDHAPVDFLHQCSDQVIGWMNRNVPLSPHLRPLSTLRPLSRRHTSPSLSPSWGDCLHMLVLGPAGSGTASSPQLSPSWTLHHRDSPTTYSMSYHCTYMITLCFPAFTVSG